MPQRNYSRCHWKTETLLMKQAWNGLTCNLPEHKNSVQWLPESIGQIPQRNKKWGLLTVTWRRVVCRDFLEKCLEMKF